MGTIYIDNQPYELKQEGQNLLAVCLSAGFDLPYFCWHPAMHSVGACRQCAVKLFRDEHDAKGRIVMSCMTAAKDGMRISVADPEAAELRQRVIEWLMVNHPHDCPVGDEGGECHLQDMTVMVGQSIRRYRFSKRTHRNQYLGPFVAHEMNRCIQCYRCVRFYRDYAGGRDFDVLGWHDDVYFGRHADGVLASEFSGNLVEVCPTGVFTDKTLQRHYTRKWDLQTAPSICVHCGLGCNTIPAERYGMLRRIYARFHRDVNGYFLCDRGRFGYEFVNSDRRIRQPLRRGPDGTLRPVSRQEALEHAGKLLRETRVVALGSPRASLETLYALRKLAGAENFHLAVPEADLRLLRCVLGILREGPAPAASLHDVRTSDAVAILGEDATNAAPMLALALRQAAIQKPLAQARARQISGWEDAALREAIQQQKGPFFVATPEATKLDDVASELYRAAPADLARLGFAVAHEIDPQAPAVANLSADVQALARRIAEALAHSERPLVVSGVRCGEQSLIESAANVAWALRRAGKPAKLCFVVPECNSLGAALLEGQGAEAALEKIRTGQAETVLIVESDLYRCLGAAAAEDLLSKARHVVVLDHLTNATTDKAELVLPAATFAEADGTLVNNEGRAQRFFRVFVPAGEVQAAWRWLSQIGWAGGRFAAPPWPHMDDIVADLARQVPALAGIARVAPPASFRMTGQKIPRQSHRHSGRTAETAHLDVHEPTPPRDADSPLAFSMEGSPLRPPAALLGRYWAPGWNSVQAVNKFQIEVGGPLHGGDPGRRLIEPAPQPQRPYFASSGEPFAPRLGEWLLIPACHIFGSEELSVLSPGIAELSPGPYIGLGRRDAQRLGLAEGAQVCVQVAGQTHVLPLRVHPGLPEGLALLPVGQGKLLGLALPAWGTLAAAESQGASP